MGCPCRTHINTHLGPMWVLYFLFAGKISNIGYKISELVYQISYILYEISYILYKISDIIYKISILLNK